ncbi:gametogenetin-binding protein 1-like [Choloepus didactylus]|uniref:gametogenetin-binding protein 1-like n=1 Tax=Choloepus didactylus TaxID=27675 RepID=UPI00189F4AB2|nr:gametogenetin-binding protein 1-like [Choloepus didactylus]
MEAPTPTPQSRILGRSSLFCFFRSLVGSKSSPRDSDKALVGGWMCSSRGQEAIPLMMDRPTTLTCALSVATPKGPQHLPGHDPSGLGLGDLGAQTSTPIEVLQVVTQSRKVRSVLPRGGQEVLGNLSEKEEKEEEEEEAVGEASGDTGATGRGYFAQALEVEPEHLRRAMGPLEVKPKAFTREEEKECLLDGDLTLASSKAGATPWNHLLSMYKQLQKSAMTKFPFKEGLPGEEEKGEEEEMEEEVNYVDLWVPGTATLQSPLHKTFRSADTVGFMESEVKKLLAVQRESRLWKESSQDVLELLTRPEFMLEEVGIVDGLHLLLEEMDEMGNWSTE